MGDDGGLGQAWQMSLDLDGGGVDVVDTDTLNFDGDESWMDVVDVDSAAAPVTPAVHIGASAVPVTPAVHIGASAVPATPAVHIGASAVPVIQAVHIGASAVPATPAVHIGAGAEYSVELDAIQLNILHLVLDQHRSVYIAGKPGCGKTHVTREIVRQFRQRSWKTNGLRLVPPLGNACA